MFLRIQATDTQFSQMLYNPPNASSSHTFIVNFKQASLTDANSAPLAKGFLTIQAQPAAVDAYFLVMLTRLLHPFKGAFELDVDGAYTTSGTVTTITVNTILSCNLEPA